MLPLDRLALLAVFLLSGASGIRLRAQDNLNSETTWTISQTITSDYYFRGLRLAGPSLQPAIDFNRGALSLGAWSNVAMTDTSSPANPEIDFYGAFRLRTGHAAFEIVPGFTVYAYPRANRSDGLYRATFEPSVAANIDLHGVRLTPKIYYDFTLEGATFEVSAALAYALKSIGTELDLSASIGTFRLNSVRPDANPREKNWGDYLTLNASIPYRVSSRGTLTFGIGYTVGTNNYFKQAGIPRSRNPAARSHALVSLGYSASF